MALSHQSSLRKQGKAFSYSNLITPKGHRNRQPFD